MLLKKKNEKKTKDTDVKAAEKPVYKVTFSPRIAAVFTRMYGQILSVDLTNNVYQVESGVLSLFGMDFLAYGNYDSLVKGIKDRIDEDDQEAFENAFGRKKMMAAFSMNRSSISGTYCFICEEKKQATLEKTENLIKDERNNLDHADLGLEDIQVAISSDSENASEAGSEAAAEEYTETEYKYLQIRAEKIADTGNGRQRCIIFFKEVISGAEENIATEKNSSEGSVDWTQDCINKIFGGKESTLFRYEPARDVMTIRRANGTDRIIEKYMTTLSARTDVTIYHDDVKKFKAALSEATEGHRVDDIISYRVNAEKANPFHPHRLICSPIYDGQKVSCVMGSLVDIKEELAKNDVNKDINQVICRVVENVYPRIFEIDLEKDLLYKIENKDGIFTKEDKGESFSGYINRAIKKGVIAEKFANKYKQLLEPGFLKKNTINQAYEIEAQLTLPDKKTESWYSDIFFRLSGNDRYINICRDISSTWNRRSEAFLREENKKFGEYNRHLLSVMAGLVEFRNVESGAHIEHVCQVVRVLLEDVAERSPQYGLTNHKIDVISEAAMMHDIGKVTIPDRILNKPGKFTPEEFEIMKTHTTAGANIIENMKMPGQEEVMSMCHEVALHHHERYDGKGYPDGLKGDDISIAAQAVGLADVYDAMLSERCYKAASTQEEACRAIIAGECGVFNPRLIQSFKSCEAKLRALYVELETGEQ